MSLVVKKMSHESQESLLRRFKNLVSQEEILTQAREKMRYVKDSKKNYEKQKRIAFLNYLDRKRYNEEK